MKVYLFDVASGLYEGEDFHESGEVNESNGVTRIAPPENRRPGQVPVYDRSVGGWRLVSIDSLRKRVYGND